MSLVQNAKVTEYLKAKSRKIFPIIFYFYHIVLLVLERELSLLRKNPNWPEGLETSRHEDRKNVIDYYKTWVDDDIIEDLDKRRNDYIVLCENYAHDFNISTTIRNAEAFLAREVWICGRRKYDARGTVGTQHRQRIFKEEFSAPVIKACKSLGYKIVVFDNIPGAKNINDYEWNPHSLMVFGQESIGVSQTALDLADDVVYIPQYGSVRSINVGTASGIAMHDYCSKKDFNNEFPGL